MLVDYLNPQLDMELLYCGHHGTTAACPEYRGVRTSEASGVFPVGVATRTFALRRRVVELSLAVRLRERLTRG